MKIDFTTPNHVYFVGIGGVSMSGLARILKSRGFTVTGSDRSVSAVTADLEVRGITVHTPQCAANITDDIDVAVLTSAIHPDNPEYQELLARQIPMMSRADLLGQIMDGYPDSIAISGTHGKTTTTSMITQILLEAGTDPTISVGGQLGSIGGNVRIGSSGYFAAEACEYTNSFLSLYPRVGLILNIEEDHLDFFKDIDDIRASFRKFASNIRPGGFLIINGEIEDPGEIYDRLDCNVLTFGYGSTDDFRISSVSFDESGCAGFTLTLSEKAAAFIPGERQYGIRLAVPGRHNVLNGAAAFAGAAVSAIDPSTAAGALYAYTGVDRRFQKLGEFDGVTVYDDYAHHPTEISATLQAARSAAKGRIFCIFQPHTYSRTKSLLPEFASALKEADVVVLADIYAARETDDLGISSATLRDRITELGGCCEYFPSFEEIENYVRKNCRKDDLLITMGAGNVNLIAKDLLNG
ncbi:MAG: UDP-N-acetylmuramate--L-alanine ligase [Lachnospiraceae bacterium]|nr:UDP-N-acetylmuramate--L-alanine ligase [Lachnospiraceae bacterium]